jgi:hypothetical protein
VNPRGDLLIGITGTVEISWKMALQMYVCVTESLYIGLYNLHFGVYLYELHVDIALGGVRLKLWPAEKGVSGFCPLERNQGQGKGSSLLPRQVQFSRSLNLGHPRQV